MPRNNSEGKELFHRVKIRIIMKEREPMMDTKGGNDNINCLSWAAVTAASIYMEIEIPSPLSYSLFQVQSANYHYPVHYPMHWVLPNCHLLVLRHWAF